MITSCTQCQHEYESTTATVSREVGTDTNEILIVCPECKYEKHVYFETPDVLTARARLHAIQQRMETAPLDTKERRYAQYQTQLAAFQRLFDSVQIRWRKKRPVEKT